MSRAPAIARDDRAGRLEPVRLGLRFAASARPDRSEHGVPLALVLGEGRLRAGSQRLGPFDASLAADLAGEQAELSVRVRNASDEPVHLESVLVGLRWTDADTAAVRFLKNGWQSWSWTGSQPVRDEGAPSFPSGPWLRGLHHPLGEPPADREGWHESSLVSVARDAQGRCCLAGVLEGGLGTGLVYWRREGEGLRVEVEVQLGVAIEPGEEIAPESIQLALGLDENALLESFAETIGARGQARTHATLPVGWCSWYQFFHDVTEQDVLRNLEALSALRSEFAVDVVQIDDGYQSAIGDWLTTNEKFPRGLAPLAAEIRAAGFRAGLWTAPFCVVPESELFRAQPGWLMRSHAPGDTLQRGLLHPQWAREGWVHLLDPTRDDVISHLEETFAALTGMGFTYHKLDFLWVVAAEARAADPGVTAASRLRRGLEAVRAGAGPDGFLLGCGCPLGPAVGLVDGMRIGPDVAPHWAPAPGAPAGIEETLPSTRGALRSILARAWMHRRLWLNDPDCLMARTEGTELQEVEVDALAGAIAVTGGMPIISDDLPRLADADRARIAATLATARAVDVASQAGAARAAGLLDTEIATGAMADTAEARVAYHLNPRDDEADVALDAGPWERLRGEALAHRGKLRLAPHASALLRAPKDVRLAVFCDYDGTFAVQDVGSTLAKTHASERRAPLWDRLSRGELDAWGYNMELLDGLPLSEETLEAFLRTVQPTPGAAELVRWCEDRGVPFRVLSDGFDRNLDRLQELHGIRFAYEANHLWYDHGHWRLAPGAPDPSCTCGTGVCKRARIEAFRQVHPKATVVHIGNGRVSDLCASEAADRVYAKDTLADELRERGVPFEPFQDLHQVRESLDRLFAP